MRVTRNRQTTGWMPPGVALSRKGFLLLRRAGGPLIIAPKDATEDEVWAGYNRFHMDKLVALAFREARKRAQKSSRPYTLTPAQEDAIKVRASGKCEVSGTFFCARDRGYRRLPFMPSVDRIDNAKGYTASNVRLVCTAVNLAMNEWGDSVFKAIAEAYVRKSQSGNI